MFAVAVADGEAGKCDADPGHAVGVIDGEVRAQGKVLRPTRAILAGETLPQNRGRQANRHIGEEPAKESGVRGFATVSREFPRVEAVAP